MDDDLNFGTSVWGTTDTLDLGPPQTKASILSSEVQFDEQSDDFSDLVETTHTDAVDDDFGDFGDFGEAEFAGSSGFEEFGAAIQVAGPSEWHSLRLDPLPSRPQLTDQIDEILQPIWGHQDASSIFMDEGIREVEGVSQILVSPESRDLYRMLVQSSPLAKPPNWTRSRIRRQHLIALGIPVNLDEVLPRANGKPLPPLQITTRPMSAPPVARNAFLQNSLASSRAGTPQASRHPTPPSHFGPKPELDHVKIQQLVRLEPDTLTLQPFSSLERHLADLRTQTAKTSSLLTHLLQIRETLQQDNETYNGLIADLVGEAQKMKSGKPRTGVVRRGSQMS